MTAKELDEELRQEFLTEARELIEQLSEKFVALEQAQHDQELLNEIFRAVHSLKGSSSFLDVPPLLRWRTLWRIF